MKRIVLGLVLTFAFAGAASAQFVPCYDPPEDPCIGKCWLEQRYSDGTYTTVIGERFENPCPFAESEGYEWGPTEWTPYTIDYCWVCCNYCTRAKNIRRPRYEQLPILKARMIFPSTRSVIAAMTVDRKPCRGGPKPGRS